jgi:outer membrane receptor protein involved in Fe transport
VTDALDIFAEGSLPLIEGAAFANILSLDLAYRRSEYRSGESTDSYKIGGTWGPSQDIRVRASFQKAVRAPNVIELFAAQGFNLFDMADDPCDTTDPNADGVAPAANCQGGAAHQLSAAAAGSGTLTSPAGQYNFLQGGNPNLESEEAETLTYGIVFQPSFIDGLNVTIDWFNIRIEDTVSIVDPGTTVSNCYFAGIGASCALITRNPGNGRLWTGNGVVSALNTNIGALETTGIDINANYRYDLGDMGVLSANMVGTYLDELVTEQGPGLAAYDCKGFFSGPCGTPNPEWRHRLRVGWETPWDVEVSGTWRFYGEVDLVDSSAAPLTGKLDSHFDAESYFDIAGNWQILGNTNLRFGVNNVLDNDPPISSLVGTTGNGNTYPQTYDSLGRWVFAGITVDF